MYAFIDVLNYQKVVVSDATLGIEAAAQKFLGDELIITDDKYIEDIIRIKTITDDNDKMYTVSIKVNKNYLPFLNVGDKIKVSYTEGIIKQIMKLDKGE